MAADAVEQWGPSAARDGNATLLPIPVKAANPPESMGQMGGMNGPGFAREKKW
jgi:hypothetical protein